MAEGYIEGSEWHGGMRTLDRIDRAFGECNMFSKNDDVAAWKASCDIIYKEVVPFLNTKEKAEVNDERIKVNQALQDYLFDSSQTKRASPSKAILADLLFEFELLMREHAAKKNLLLPIKSDPGKAIIEGGF